MNPQCLQLPLCPLAWHLLTPLSSAFSLGQRAREQCCSLLGFLSLWANACGLFCTKPFFSGAPALERGQGKQAPVLSLTAAPGLWVKEGLRAVRWALSCLSFACEELSRGAEPLAGPWRGTLPLLERSQARQVAVCTGKAGRGLDSGLTFSLRVPWCWETVEGLEGISGNWGKKEENGKPPEEDLGQSLSILMVFMS